MKRTVSLLVACRGRRATLFVVVPFAGAQLDRHDREGHRQGVQVRALDEDRTARQSHFKVTNKGKLKHDFKIAGKKTMMLKPGKTASLTVTLAKGKTYTYICTVPGHAQLGMKGKFKAT